ncbi:hypothetical protein GGR54DRAFT_652992 [Hypoxylon sp. NC1633]|nr:hypothetical protein GGR54DRAFT_652992 [Hypoxylon sp. NC1633]
MAPLPNIDFASETFKFRVGRNHKEFVVHKAAFVSISPVLCALITGDMKEARQGFAVWEDTDEDIFQALCEFVYQGRYTSPVIYKPAVPLLSRPSLLFLQRSETPSSMNRELINVIRYHTGVNTRSNRRPGALSASNAENLDWSDKLFSSSEKLFWIGRTHGTSCRIARMIQLVYDNTVEDDMLRLLLATYVATNIGKFLLYPDMERLLKECRELGFDSLVALARVMKLKETMAKPKSAKDARP